MKTLMSLESDKKERRPAKQISDKGIGKDPNITERQIQSEIEMLKKNTEELKKIVEQISKYRKK